MNEVERKYTDIPDCLYESDNDFEIPNLLLEKQAGKLLLPLVGYGSVRRQSLAQTVHFYVDDYRFDNIWKNPAKILNGKIVAAVEPNTSVFDTTPLAYGLQQIYKKRWIARYWQECGLLVYADLNVSPKFYDYNRLGIPQGYNAFFTRGYAEQLDCLKSELEIARDISGLKVPNIIVYGGGDKIWRFCLQNDLLYIVDLMTKKDM
ncbi:MAG: DUF4417 domain-containing protein [Prevotellaceae bacterium]|jgi:hypothetical protein|nr:DUF4417 domain-containing protein [Prevotellaceae bacterium]